MVSLKGATVGGEVNLAHAEISGQLLLDGATVSGHLNMNSLTVGQSMFMRGTAEQPATFNTVDLIGAEISGRLSLTGATISGHLDMNGLTVGQDMFMRGTAEQPATFSTIDLAFAHIKGNLNFSNAKFEELNLSSTRIEGELWLGSSYCPPGSRLILLDAHAGTVQDWWDENAWKKRKAYDAWPKSLRLDGFTYGRLREASGSDMLNRPAEWYLEWLQRDTRYSPRPYEQLADTLRKAGEPAKANAILYASRERARERAKRQAPPQFIGLTLLKWTTGYGLGLKYFRSLG